MNQVLPLLHAALAVLVMGRRERETTFFFLLVQPSYAIILMGWFSQLHSYNLKKKREPNVYLDIIDCTRNESKECIPSL